MQRRAFLYLAAASLGHVTGLALPFVSTPLASLLPLLSDPVASAWAASPDDWRASKATFARLSAGQAHSVRLHPGSQPYTLAPGQVVTFDCQGYCMDADRAVPGRNEPLAFRPITGYIAPQLLRLYREVMRLAGAGETGGADVQNLVWGFRADKAKPGTRERALLNRAQPGGADLYATTSRGDKVSGRDKARRSGGAGGGSGGRDPLEQLLGQFLGDFSRPSQDLMRALQGMKVKQPLPGSEQQYSMLSNQIAGRASGQGGLAVRGAVANGSDAPYVFDPTLWALESPRPVQRVALPLFRQAKSNTAPLPQGQDQKQPPQQPGQKDRTAHDDAQPAPQPSQEHSNDGNASGRAKEFQMHP